MFFQTKNFYRAFTLIELLIVVAIIAILAAIAVPNFLEAQTRAKISRCAADMRAIRTGLVTYKLDTNKYPETDYGAGTRETVIGAGMDRLTTPISYLSTVPLSPFKEKNIGGAEGRHCKVRGCFLYVRGRVAEGTPAHGQIRDGDNNGYDDDYSSDRVLYILLGGGSLAERFGQRTKGEWELKSVGPNNVDDFNTIGLNARSYDPTNGTVSAGDVVVFSDIFGFAGK